MTASRSNAPPGSPCPGEIPAAPHIRSRFARLGRFGASLSATRPGPEAGAVRAEPDPESELELEDRLFFDYLRGDYSAASADLETLEARSDTRARRLALLGLRVQIFWARGDAERARDVAGYLIDAVGGAGLPPRGDADRAFAGRRVRIGPRLGPIPRPEGRPAPAHDGPHSEPNPGDREDTLLLNPFAPFGPPGIDLHRGPAAGRRPALRTHPSGRWPAGNDPCPPAPDRADRGDA